MKTIEKDYLKVSFGNSKLPKGTMIFNLPAVITCPLRTPLCEKSCYALKAEVQYRHVVPQARHHNLDRVRKGLFKGLMIEAIQKHHKKIKAIRIHESGDFLSQSYLNDWFAIAKEFPEFKFYAYTKSFHLTFDDKPANFTLIASFDETTDALRLKFYNDKREQFDNTFTIVDKDAKATCIADCTKCSMCWTSKGHNITVNKH